ncbi:hypothetical protein GIB67_032696 [Kingdonia uniflora]|uniref:Rab-GAP TBC domain-containing protein n=1 Tax=Kingdonia uniflora TaxID=39325 RepID=A0A7J7MVW6_9MAGN|nr:hypothetical protein GIB67_032696 [Kingdonia uniflora]
MANLSFTLPVPSTDKEGGRRLYSLISFLRFPIFDPDDFLWGILDLDGLMDVLWGILDIEQPDTQTITKIVVPSVELIYSYAEFWQSLLDCSKFHTHSRLCWEYPQQTMLGTDDVVENIALTTPPAASSDIASATGGITQVLIKDDFATSSVQYYCDGCSTVIFLSHIMCVGLVLFFSERPQHVILITVGGTKNGTLQLDLPRTFPGHPWLDTLRGHASLHRVLVGYSFKDSHVGYCQGLNCVSAMLLLMMKIGEDAFWMLAVLLENVLVNDCYTPNLSGCYVEQRVFQDMLAKKYPRIAAHLEDMEFDVSLVATEWFLCLFSKSLPSETTMRVWDVLSYEGAMVLFHVVLAIFRAQLYSI